MLKLSMATDTKKYDTQHKLTKYTLFCNYTSLILLENLSKRRF